MLTTNGPRWFDRPRPASRWPSFVVSVGATVALFAAAFSSMRSVSHRLDRAAFKVEQPVTWRLEPPRPSRPEQIPPRAARSPTARSAAPAAPVATPSAITPAVPAAPLAPTIPATTAPPRDSSPSASPAPSATIPIGIAPLHPSRGGNDTAMAAPRGGAPMAPSGFSIGARTPNTARYRDSVAQVRALSIPELARGKSIDAQDAAALGISHRAADLLRRRATTAGSARDVAVQLGQGKGGVGAVGGGGTYVAAGGVNGLGVHGSIEFPLFSSGPSREQRKRDAKIDAEYQLRLRALDDRILLRRDSVRADSMRADSLRRAALRRDSLARAKATHPLDVP